MELLSKEYGWLPSEIRNQSVEDIENYLSIIAVRNQLMREEEYKMRKKYEK